MQLCCKRISEEFCKTVFDEIIFLKPKTLPLSTPLVSLLVIAFFLQARHATSEDGNFHVSHVLAEVEKPFTPRLPERTRSARSALGVFPLQVSQPPRNRS